MKKILVCLSFLIGLNTTHAYSTEKCDKVTLSNQPHKVLSCYIAQPESITQPVKLLDRHYDEKNHVTIERYNFKSQYWPKEAKVSPSRLWEHRLNIYKPDQLSTTQGLLFINGGTRNPSNDYNPDAQKMNFARIAADTHSIVVDLQDIPNQYLTFSDEVPRREDGIVAYTWNRYMENPRANIYWPLHLPMTKAVVKAMDAIQKIVKDEYNFQVTNFMVSGASKRGWTTWMTALVDQRVNAIAPIVIDILNIQKNLDLIYSSYNQWPPAFHDYVEQKITDRFNTPQFAQLIKIQDPIAYLNCDECATFVKRLSIPKYIISASGDDFFVPDSLSVYANLLPGETKLRMVPNQSHNIDMQIVEDSLLTFYRSVLKKSYRPNISWKVAANCDFSITMDKNSKRHPEVKLWEANNENARDFRLAANIKYENKTIKGACNQSTCRYTIHVDRPAKGWKASFVEAKIHQDNDEAAFVFTTPACVIGTNN